jgi:hypothetical protein
MGKNKLARFAENKILPNVIQPTREDALNGFELKENGERIFLKTTTLSFWNWVVERRIFCGTCKNFS